MRRASRGLLAAAVSLLLASCVDEERNWWDVMGGQPAAPENTAPESGLGTGGSGAEPGEEPGEERVDLGFPSGQIESWIKGTREEGETGWLTEPPEQTWPPGISGVEPGDNPLRAGPNGAWVQGTWAVEQGARASELLGQER